ncbi:MAG TPA: hypothetical protein VGR71_12340 [Nitrospira sp.]|nr:hypothetical protein [Nitrospira sp.]
MEPTNQKMYTAFQKLARAVKRQGYVELGRADVEELWSLAVVRLQAEIDEREMWARMELKQSQGNTPKRGRQES